MGWYLLGVSRVNGRNLRISNIEDIHWVVILSPLLGFAKAQDTWCGGPKAKNEAHKWKYDSNDNNVNMIECRFAGT